MTALLLSLLWKLWPIFLAVGGGLLWGWKQRRAGRAEVLAKQAAADRRVRDISDDVQSDVGSMSPEQIDAELRKRAPK